MNCRQSALIRHNKVISLLIIQISEIGEVFLCTGPRSFKQTQQQWNRIRIEGGEAFLVNCGHSALIRL